MRELPKAVAGTEVGKRVELKIWRNKRLISKKLNLGRLESSEEFKTKQNETPNKDKEFKVDSLKIIVRDVNDNDINTRKLEKGTKGALILEILNRSPLQNSLSANDIILEVQKKPIINSENLNKVVEDIIKKGEKTLLLTIINNRNQRRYLELRLIKFVQKLILIAGPTASGKSKLAIHLSKKLNGEIINADSMQIYKEFSILSSRPTKNEEKKSNTICMVSFP